MGCTSSKRHKHDSRRTVYAYQLQQKQQIARLNALRSSQRLPVPWLALGSVNNALLNAWVTGKKKGCRDRVPDYLVSDWEQPKAILQLLVQEMAALPVQQGDWHCRHMVTGVCFEFETKQAQCMLFHRALTPAILLLCSAKLYARKKHSLA